VIRAATIYLVPHSFHLGLACGAALEDEWREQEMERFNEEDRGCVG